MPDIFIDKETNEPRPEADQPLTEKSQQKLSLSPLNHAEESVNKLLHDAQHKIGLLSAYSLHPKGITFANQEPDEVVILFIRRHFITNVPWIVATFFLFLFPPILVALAQIFNIFPFSLPVGLTSIVIAFYYLISFSYAFGKFVSWFYNIGVVTQKRIIDLDSSNILSHHTATANFGEIVDVKFIQRGFFQSFFDYGDIHIQTEAIRANFEFTATPKPTVVTDIISDLRVAQKGGHNGNS